MYVSDIVFDCGMINTFAFIWKAALILVTVLQLTALFH